MVIPAINKIIILEIFENLKNLTLLILFPYIEKITPIKLNTICNIDHEIPAKLLSNPNFSVNSTIKKPNMRNNCNLLEQEYFI